LIDHLVTFIPCQFLTGGGLTEILGILPGGFWPGAEQGMAAEAPRNIAFGAAGPFDKASSRLLKRSNNRGERIMKLYDSIGPNPRIVRMFMAEKGIEMPRQTIDLRGGENREAAHLKRNPHGQMPTLELDDGHFVSEITAICEYLEERHPSPPMIGASPEERAECRMWTRRLDLNIAEPLANGYRYGEGQKFFEKRIVVVPEASPGLKKVAANRLQWLNGQMDDKREYICGKRFTLADILLYCWLEFGNQVGQPLDPANANIVVWLARVGARPSAKA
jgi:glutathione S-transferase